LLSLCRRDAAKKHVSQRRGFSQALSLPVATHLIRPVRGAHGAERTLDAQRARSAGARFSAYFVNGIAQFVFTEQILGSI
jgi:hypothetical protein